MSGNRLRFRPWPPAIVAALLFGPSGTAGAGLADDPRDHGYVTVVVNRTLETERTHVDVPWSNPSTGNRGVVVIERTYYRDPSTPCREYRRTVERPGQPTVMVRGTGCRIGGGIWTLDETAAGGASGSAPAAAGSPPAEPPAAAPMPASPAAPAKSEQGRPTGGGEKAKPKAEARAEPPPLAKVPPTPPAPTASPPSPSQTLRVPGYTLPSKIPL